MAETESYSTLELTGEIVAAHVANNSVHTKDVPELIKAVHSALAGLGQAPAEPEAEKPVGAVSIRKSLASPDKIISMIDGKPYTTLKRHITKHDYDQKSYREAFGLPKDYPMTAPAFSEQRREIANRLGLGRKKVEAPVEALKSAPAKRGRKPKAVSGAAG